MIDSTPPAASGGVPSAAAATAAGPADVPVLVDPSPGWRAQGLALAAELRAALAPTAVHVEHIGSTAIPGMAAKPVLDLQVAVVDLAAAERDFAGPLADRGFLLSRHRHDHVPAGLDDDPRKWAKRLWTRRPDQGARPASDGTPAVPDVTAVADAVALRAVNLHVRRVGSPNERLALLFRDWFRAHPEAVPAYARFKRLLAEAVADTGVYADVKDPVVDLVVTVAEPWAEATGWAPYGG
ncbi:GrpB family protein [Streptomyces sp. NPDC004111]|uniref:GrpB family protein n=1 Tax=Streptomyces sp. NPDC004111 TaxID=3364690 RepID=UPI0036A52841